jgi:hypothetical protein
MKRALALVLFAGCTPDLTNLDCATSDDLTCPTGYWCQEHSSDFSTCADISRVPIPDFTLDAIGSMALPQGTLLTLVGGMNNTVFVRVHNLSTRDAETLIVTLTASSCTGLDGAGIDITDAIAAGGTYEFALPFIMPDVSCGADGTGNVYMLTEGKQFSSPFQVSVSP